MKKRHSSVRRLLIILLLPAILSCRTTDSASSPVPPADQEEADIASMMFDLSPGNGRLYFFTAVTREQYRDKEIESCRDEAARQLSRYIQINGVTYARTSESVRGTIVREAADVAFNNDLAMELREQLEPVREIQTEEGTAALFSYPVREPLSLSYRPSGQNSVPDWVEKAPSIPGFQTAVGFTGPRRFLERTLQQADKNALATLLEQRTGSLNTTQQDWQTNRGSSSAALTTEKAAGSIRQAYILSRWRDRKGNFYSLAVCPLP